MHECTHYAIGNIVARSNERDVTKFAFNSITFRGKFECPAASRTNFTTLNRWPQTFFAKETLELTFQRAYGCKRGLIMTLDPQTGPLTSQKPR